MPVCQVDAQLQVVRKLEEKERLLQGTISTAERELALRTQALDMNKRKVTQYTPHRFPNLICPRSLHEIRLFYAICTPSASYFCSEEVFNSPTCEITLYRLHIKKGLYSMKGHNIATEGEIKPSVGPPGSGVCIAVRGGAHSARAGSAETQTGPRGSRREQHLQRKRVL